jgi:hypothetical protein
MESTPDPCFLLRLNIWDMHRDPMPATVLQCAGFAEGCGSPIGAVTNLNRGYSFGRLASFLCTGVEMPLCARLPVC